MGGKGKNTGVAKNSGTAPLVNNGYNMATGSQSLQMQMQQGEQPFNCQTNKSNKSNLIRPVYNYLTNFKISRHKTSLTPQPHPLTTTTI